MYNIELNREEGSLTYQGNNIYTLSSPNIANSAFGDYISGFRINETRCITMEVISFVGGGPSNNGGAYEGSVFPCSGGPRLTPRNLNVYTLFDDLCILGESSLYIRQGSPWTLTFRLSHVLCAINNIASEHPIWEHSVDFGDCPTTVVSDPMGTDPINLRTGDKAETVTDLSLNTTTGTLSFTRTYRQSQISDITQPMGLGWTHSYDLYLTENSSITPNELHFNMSQGGIAKFYEDTTNQYKAFAGSSATIDASGR